MSHIDYIPTHPGEVLKDELSARGISQKDSPILQTGKTHVAQVYEYKDYGIILPVKSRYNDSAIRYF